MNSTELLGKTQAPRPEPQVSSRAAHTLFVDIDLPEPSLFDHLTALFGRRRDHAAPRLAALRQVLQSPLGAGFRIYRTAAGLRVLATHPAFVQLCRLQHSFRARLTPKPWRLGLSTPPATYPRDDPDDQQKFAEWLAAYTRASETRATCHFIDSVGSQLVDSSVAPILRLHDDYTKALSTLPLA